MLHEKECTKCLLIKPYDQFYKAKVGYESQCKECRLNKMVAKYRIEHPDIIRRSGRAVWIEDKRCSHCKVVKPINEFQKHSQRSGGITAYCKDCIKLRNNTDFHRERNRTNLHKSRKLQLEKDPITFKLRRMVKEAAIRAKKKSIPFDITFEYLTTILPDKCPVLAVPFNFSSPKLSCDASPSLDRFYPEKGYVKGNVFIISRLANVMKNKGTVEQHINLTNWMLAIEKQIQN